MIVRLFASVLVLCTTACAQKALRAWQVSEQEIRVKCDGVIAWDSMPNQRSNITARVNGTPVPIHALRLQFHLDTWILRFAQIIPDGQLEVQIGPQSLSVERPSDIQAVRTTTDGNPIHGKQLFESAQIGCLRCHRHGEDGQAIGPKLSGRGPTDIPWTRADILDSFEAVHPDYPRVQLSFHNGLTTIGVARPFPTYWLVGDSKGKSTRIDPRAIDVWQPVPGSIMPPDFDADLTPAEIEDIVAFLCQPTR